ncbi:MAG: ATP-dependent 6-phosphofructokinase [Bacteroidia bacterium]|nr:ATP-dependent 6-phosphofructokinase [Bacteroidia bacterium]
MKQSDLEVKTLGPCKITSPSLRSTEQSIPHFHFVEDTERVLFDMIYDSKKNGLGDEPLNMERAGPRKNIYFDPSKTTAAIVTCGGLCPGINVVIRSIVLALNFRYGVTKIFGVQYGYEGFIPEYQHSFIDLDPDVVGNINQFGGTILGSSRGQQNVEEIVDCLERNNINLLFAIGGDGTLKGAYAIHEEIENRGLKIAVAGIPKTIDNDINHIEKSFGFETSVTISSPIIRDAHNEAKGAYNGIAIIKLMGRDSGFIAANAVMAMPEVNVVLVPEVEFDLHGEKGLLEFIKDRINEKHHCVIVVAEGAGQNLFDKESDVLTDASGNILHEDIGVYLKLQIKHFMEENNIRGTIKYIDPSYIIRSAPANPVDSIFCNQLALAAVHGAMAGKTGFVVGQRSDTIVYLPIPLVTAERKKIDVEGDLWLTVLESTGQPISMKND